MGRKPIGMTAKSFKALWEEKTKNRLGRERRKTYLNLVTVVHP